MSIKSIELLIAPIFTAILEKAFRKRAKKRDIQYIIKPPSVGGKFYIVEYRGFTEAPVVSSKSLGTPSSSKQVGKS